MEKCMVCGYNLDVVENAVEGLKQANRFRIQAVKQINAFLYEKGLYDEYVKWSEKYWDAKKGVGE